MQREKLSNISIEPSQDKRVFDTLEVNERNEINGAGAWDRSRDTEFKILNELANKLGIILKLMEK
nr:deaminase domain-containing protein [Clostridium septicum]